MSSTGFSEFWDFEFYNTLLFVSESKAIMIIIDTVAAKKAVVLIIDFT